MNPTLIKISGNIGTSLVIIGALCKIQHYPYHLEITVVGALLFLVFWIWILNKILKTNRSIIHTIFWMSTVLFIPIIGSWLYYHFEIKPVKPLP
jgi:hypothetical protein